jgi:(p)ppGpp synthase/HD superfamily hydrolase
MTAYTGRFDKALIYASAVRRLIRPARDFSHAMSRSLATAALVIEAGGDEDEAIAALLLDLAATDLNIVLSREIHRLFGGDVSGMIRNCLTSDYRRPDRAVGNVKTVTTILAAQLARSTLVALADSVISAMAMHTEFLVGGEQRANGDAADTQELVAHYDLLARSFSQLCPGPLSERFGWLVAELNALVSPYAGAAPHTVS